MNKTKTSSANSLKPGRPAITEDKRREMREKIANSTQQLFQSEGYRQISMRRIAREVGCSAMTLYQYYDGKIDLLHTLWADVFADVFDRLEAIEFREQSPSKQLMILATTYVNYWLENPDHYRLVFMTEGVNQPDVSMFIKNPDIVARYQIFAGAMIGAQTTALSVEELRMKLDALICFLHGITHNQVTISGYEWPTTDYLVAAAISGLID